MSQNRTLLFVGGAIALLICVALLVGGGYYLGRQTSPAEVANQPTEEQATPTVTPVVVTATSTPLLPSSATAEQTDEPDEDDSGETPATPQSPEISSIIFAEEVDASGNPIEPATSFEEGISQVHVVFEHDNMLPDYTWERVWYHDGQEMLKTADQWTGNEAGRFDYFLDTQGEALPPGKWELELYVEDELIATGEFTIGPEKIAVASTTEPTTEPTNEPTIEPTNQPTTNQ